jgi:hypothetical protein
VFPFGNTVTITNDTIAASASNLYIKTRGINGQTAGPYSTPAGFVYTPVQVTDSISDTTKVGNAGSESLLAALALTQLLKYVDGLFNSNTTISQVGGGLFDKMFKQFESNTGRDIRTSIKNTMISAVSGQFNGTVSQTASNSSFNTLGSTITFTAPYTGTYKMDVLVDQNSSGARGGRGTSYFINNFERDMYAVGISDIGQFAGNTFDPSDSSHVTYLFHYEPEDKIQVVVDLCLTSTGAVISTAGSGGKGIQSWMDFALSNTASLTSGVSYDLKFYALNWTESNPTYSADFDVGYNVYTISA